MLAPDVLNMLNSAEHDVQHPPTSAKPHGINDSSPLQAHAERAERLNATALSRQKTFSMFSTRQNAPIFPMDSGICVLNTHVQQRSALFSAHQHRAPP
jgi:hypothetical protein